MTPVTKQMIGAGHDVLLKRGMVLSYEILADIYTAMDQAAPSLKTLFDTCPTCEQLLQRIAELERQLEEARKDAERWNMTIEIGEDVLRHPMKRKVPACVNAYMKSIHAGFDMTHAIDAAIDAAMQKGQS